MLAPDELFMFGMGAWFVEWNNLKSGQIISTLGIKLITMLYLLISLDLYN